MCLDPSAHVQAKVYDRLVAAGVHPHRALAVSKKVRRSYSERRRTALARVHDSTPECEARRLDA